jgi:hypothetical protein
VSLGRGWGRTQGAVARGLASLEVEFSEEAVEPVTGYRVDMLLHGGGGGATGRCAVEVGVDFVCWVVALRCPRVVCHHRCHSHNIQHRHLSSIFTYALYCYSFEKKLVLYSRFLYSRLVSSMHGLLHLLAALPPS